MRKAEFFFIKKTDLKISVTDTIDHPDPDFFEIKVIQSETVISEECPPLIRH